MTADPRLELIVECLIACARHDFSMRIPVSDDLDDVDAIATGINIMAEDLERSVASRSELEAAYNELREAQTRVMNAAKLAAVGQLAGGVAHEVNNPAAWAIAAVAIGKRRMGDIESTLDGLGLSAHPELRRGLEDVRDVFERTMEGLTRIREVAGELSSTFAPAKALKVEPLLLDDVVRSTCNLVRPSLRPGVAMTVNLGDVPPVRACRGRLAQVVTNLVANALDALDGSAVASVAVTTTSDEQAAVLFVDDSGPGVPVDLRERIFEPFFTGRKHGMGLGLALVSEIVRQHDGDIAVGSAPLGGARFEVRLPLAK